MASAPPASGRGGKAYPRQPLNKVPKPSTRPPPAASVNGHDGGGLAFRSRQEAQELRRRLAAELEQVRALAKRLEAHELQLASAAGYTRSQLSATEPNTPTPARSTAGPPRRQLNVSDAASERKSSKGADKRVPKAEHHHRNSDSVLRKEASTPTDHSDLKKSKVVTGKKQSLGFIDTGCTNLADKKLFVQAFKSCSTLLAKLMKHKHGWVFNVPVDVKGLGLRDYHSVIKCPMDLGTVKSRLAKDSYNSPLEFAEDVRLTFQNAMTYNGKGHDVHIMAEQLLHIFEEHWPSIEAEFSQISRLPATKKPPQLDLSTLERSDSTVHTVAVELKAKPVNHLAHIGRLPAPKKPKAKDPNKRDMTFEEKQRLSNNLQNLPPEKLLNVVQIIKKRNSSLSHNDDEIEVDIDSVDVETLWELERFVTNYKKCLSKNKRKAELASLASQETDHNAPKKPHKMIQDLVLDEKANEIMTVLDEKCGVFSSPVTEQKKGNDATKSNNSSSSGSDSGSSSSDSDTESNSGFGSDAAHSCSPGT